MKICHATTVHPSFDVRIFVKECISLAKAGYDVTLVVAGDGADITKDNVKIKMVPVSYRFRAGRIFKAPQTLFNVLHSLKPDIIHFHDPEMLLCVRKMKKKGYKVIYDVHEDVPRQLLVKHWIPSILRYPLARIIERYENKRASEVDYIIAATPYIENRFKEINSNTCNVKNYPLSDEFDITIDKKKPDTPHICYIGGITTVRGINEIMAAAEHLPVVLDLAGPLEKENILDEYTNRKSRCKYVYHGVVGREKIVELLSHAMAGLVLLYPAPNHLNALPTKLFEYMLAGVPVIASDFPVWREIVEGNNCGICVDPFNIDQIKDAIQYFINNPIEAKEMGSNGRNAAIKEFNWDIEEEKLLNVYQKLLEV